MIQKLLFLFLTTQLLYWNLICGENYLIGKVDEDHGFPNVQLVTGLEGGGTRIGGKAETIKSFRRKTIFSSGVGTANGSIQFVSNGSYISLYGSFGSSYFSLLPTSALGTDYIVSTCHPPGDYASVLVIATHSQRTAAVITFRLNGTLTFEGQQYSDGSDLTLNLGPSDAHAIHSPYDLTGTVVRASDSVAVYAGMVYSNNLVAFNQLLPVKHHGQEYVVAVDDHSGLYYLQIVSDYRDTGIMFNNGSTDCIAESGVYRRQLSRDENIFFISSRPVMTSLCRESTFSSGATIVPPVKLYRRTTSMHIRNVLKILTDENATDISVRVKSGTAPINWETIPGTRYKVGTSRPNIIDVVCITSDTSHFATLAYYNYYIFNGGFNFSSRPRIAEIALPDKSECAENDVHSNLDNLGFDIKGDISNLSDSERSSLLNELSKIYRITAEFEDIIGVVANITTSITPNSTDLENIASILEKNNATDNIMPQTVDSVLEIYNKVLQTPPEVLTEAQEYGRIADRFLKIVDSLTDRLQPDPGGHSRFVTESFAAVVCDLTNQPREAFPLGLQVTEASSEPSRMTESSNMTYDVQFVYPEGHRNKSSIKTQYKSAVFFEESFIRQIISNNTGRNVRLSMNYYSNPVLFTLSENSSQHVLKSKVISAQILVDGKPITELENSNITITFSQLEPLTCGSNGFYSCAYWNYNGNESIGSWSKDDCQFVTTKAKDKCVCDHLASFAVLLDHRSQIIENTRPDKSDCAESKVAHSSLDKLGLHIKGDISNLSDSQHSSLLNSISKINTNKADFEEIIGVVANITTAITPSLNDLENIATIIESNNSTVNITSQTVNSVLEIYNKVLQTPPEVLTEAQGNNRVADRFLKIVDSLTDRLQPEQGGHSRFVTESFAAVVCDLTNRESPDTLPLGLQVTEASNETDDIQFVYREGHSNKSYTKTQSKSSVFFEESFLRQIVNNNTGRNVRLSMNYYSKPVLFTLSENSSRNSLKSKVISAKILVDGKPITELDNSNITITFSKLESLTSDTNGFYSCAYWNFNGNKDTGSWSKDGCHFITDEEEDKCVCDHLTNFAILLDYYGQETVEASHALTLSVITQIGLIFSIVGLSITVISHLLFRDKRRTAETRPQWTLFNLALAQLGSWIVFLAGIDQTENHVGCIVVAALLHYFILASFMWMLAMAVLYYLLLVKVLGTYTSWYMLKTGIPAWSLPVLPVVVVLAIDTELYRGGETYCWMSLTAFYYAFGGPVALILLINSVLYAMVVVSICNRTKNLGQSGRTPNKTHMKNIKAAFLSFIVLGLSWIFGFLAISDARVVFQYIFCITSSTQGFLIFLFFTLQDQRFRDSIRNCYNRFSDRLAKRSKGKDVPAHLTKTTSDTSESSKLTENTV